MFNDIKTVVMENWDNRYRLFRLANYDLKRQTRGTVLGWFWNILNPALQILVYWFVFAVGFRATRPSGEYPFLIWLIVGIIPWFYMSAALTTGTRSILNYSGILTRMCIPLSIVPVKAVLTEFMGHIWSMAVVLALFLASGHRLVWGSINILYFAFASLFFLIGFALFASAITVLFRDFEKIMASMVRLLLFVSPVMWTPEGLDHRLIFVLRLNPFAYLIEGYRNSILYGTPLIYHWLHGLYFWVVTLIILLLGVHIHMKFRKQFIDLL